MKKFLVLYRTPVATLEGWSKTDPEVMKAEEAKMEQAWMAWEEKNKAMLAGPTTATGKTKKVTKDGVADSKNDIMLYSMVEADSSEAAAEIFKDHPHLEIPDSWIEVLPATPVSEMKGAQ